MRNLPFLAVLASLLFSAIAIASPQSPRPQLATATVGSFGTVTEHSVMRFTREGALLQRHGGAALGLRLVAWSRGAVRADLDAVPPIRANLHRVHYQHEGFIERYELRSNGFEQSFVLDEPPAGTGDLVLRVAATGAAATPRGSQHAPIHFRDADGSTIRYGCVVAFGRGEERQPIATRVTADGHIELVVPAALLESCSYPLTIDPTVAPLFSTTPGIGQSIYDSDVARNENGVNYLVVWRQNIAGVGKIFVRSLYPDGSPVGPSYQVNTLGDGRNPAIASMHGICVVVWEEDDRIYGRFHYGNGPAAGSANPWSQPGVGGRDRRPDVTACGGSEFVFGYDHTPPGAAEPTEIRVQHGFDHGSLGWGIGPVRTLESVTNGHVEGIALPQSSTYSTVGVAPPASSFVETRASWSRWYPTPAPGDFDLRTASFRIRGASIGGNFVVLDGPENVVGAAAIGPSETKPDIAAMASNVSDPTDLRYLLVWEVDDDIKGQMFTPTTTTGPTLDISTNAATAAEPSVGAGTCEFTVAYRYSDSGDLPHIRAARILTDGTIVYSSAWVANETGSIYALPRVSSRAIQSQPIHQDNGCLITSSRLTTSTLPTTTDIRVAVWEPAGEWIIPYGTPCPGPNGELPTIGWTGNAYPGSSNFEVTLSNAPPVTIAALLISDSITSAPIPGAPGCNAYVGLPLLFAIPSTTQTSGTTSRGIDFPCGIPAGFQLALQWIVYTPGHNAFGWISSDDLDLIW